MVRRTHILQETFPFSGYVVRNRHVSAWCGRRDSNPHNFRHWNLNPARLPVPPRPLTSIMSGRDAAGGGCITWAQRLAANKWAFRHPPGQGVTAGQTVGKMVRIGSMATSKPLLDRRTLITGLGAAALSPMW